MADNNRVDSFLDALEEDWRRQRVQPLLPSGPDGQDPCVTVSRRNRTSFGIAVALTGVVVVGCWKFLQAVGGLSNAAQIMGWIVVAMAGLCMGWLLLTTFVAMRLATWAAAHTAPDTNLEPDSATERALVQHGCLGLEFRPPLSWSRPLRKTLRA